MIPLYFPGFCAYSMLYAQEMCSEWVDLEKITLSEVAQTEKDKCVCFPSFEVLSSKALQFQTQHFHLHSVQNFVTFHQFGDLGFGTRISCSQNDIVCMLFLQWWLLLHSCLNNWVLSVILLPFC